MGSGTSSKLLFLVIIFYCRTTSTLDDTTGNLIILQTAKVIVGD